MRGLIPGLENPQPLASGLPAAFHDNLMATRFVAALDEAIAPIVNVLDNLDAHFDPALTPADFLPWLASWLGLELDENWSEAQQRRMVSKAVELYQLRGTRRGVAMLLSLYVGIDEAAVEVDDSGGVAWSVSPNGALPGDRGASVTTRLRVDDPQAIDRQRVERLLATAVPAHVAWTVDVVAA